MYEIYFLGTGATKPTIHRFPACIALRYMGDIYLFDAGEGCQLKLGMASLSPNKIKAIFLTHFHGDHILGVPGLIYTMTKADRKEPLYIYGPKGLNRQIHHLLKLSYGRIGFEIITKELEHGSEIEHIKAFEVEHGVPALGYLFKEPDSVRINKVLMKKYNLKPNKKFRELKEGKSVEINGIKITPEEFLINVKGMSFAYTGDTKYSEKVIDSVKNIDILIHESTYLSKDRDAFEQGHSSAKDAALVAKKANVKYLFLTHISPRYVNAESLLEEASEIFPHTYLAEDLLKLEVRSNCVSIYKHRWLNGKEFIC